VTPRVVHEDARRDLRGDTAKAKSAYNGLFDLWKNADPDISVLVQARSEYAKLPQ
jgi:hypothetical protein